MERTVIELNENVKHALQVCAVRDRKTMKDIITDAIMDYLHKVNYKLDT